MAEEKQEYHLCPFGNTDKPRMCPAKHMDAGWKCPLERGNECAVLLIAFHMESRKAAF
ncbi:MAG: hypothetical protein JSW02_08040 [candidate division WOR-3 bacterium]|nr:MAG: hypothetical protein JSW02_08040 [candidate division WOR-3 bacterium]